MKTRDRLTSVVTALNALGLAGYLVWLGTSRHRILYTRDGVLFLLPCVAFLFVFACLHHAKKPPREPGEEGA